MQPEGWHFCLGKMECFALADGSFRYPPEAMFANASASDVDRALRQHGWPIDSIETPYTCLLVRNQGKWLLIDVGAGLFAGSTGWLPDSLLATGIQSADIDTIIITHGHPDHVGGNLTADGQPRYANARYVIAGAEWEYWTSGAVLEGPAATFAHIFHEQLTPVAERMTYVDGDTEIVPGITVVLAPGHTPGHMAVRLQSEGQQLIHVSDAAIHPLHLEHPAWQPIYDVLPEVAIATKQRLFDQAVADAALVFAHHFPPFPNLGHIVKEPIGWRWQPVDCSGSPNEVIHDD